MVREIMAENQIQEGTDFEIEVYTSPDQLREKLRGRPDYYQLLLMDIGLDHDNGMEVARELLKNQAACRLIYITAYREYVFDCFDTRPLQYLLKPVKKDKLAEALLYDYQNNYKSEQQLLCSGDKILPVRVKEILYVESMQHKAVIRLCSGQSVFWKGSLSALQKELSPQLFCRCHNSYLINFFYVSRIERYEAALSNGTCVPVSKQNYSKVIDKYIEYLKT